MFEYSVLLEKRAWPIPSNLRNPLGVEVMSVSKLLQILIMYVGLSSV